MGLFDDEDDGDVSVPRVGPVRAPPVAAAKPAKKPAEPKVRKAKEPIVFPLYGQENFRSHFVDLIQWGTDNPPDPIPPDPENFTKEALSERPSLSWLAGVEIQLSYPNSPNPADQRAQLAELLDEIRPQCTVLDGSVLSDRISEVHAPVIALDTETTGLDVRMRYDYDGRLNSRLKIVGLSLATSPHRGYYLPLRHTTGDGVPNWDPDVIAEWVQVIHSEFYVIYHNAAYDREVLALNGVSGLRPYPYFSCTQILDYIRDQTNKQHGLKHLAETLLGRHMIEIHELFHGVGEVKPKAGLIRFDQLCATTAYIYAGSDACNTFGLYAMYAGAVPETNIYTVQPVPVAIDHKLSDVRRRLTRTGLPINFEWNYYAALDAMGRVADIERFVLNLVGRPIDLGSPKQLSALLFDELRIPPVDEYGKPAVRGKSGIYSTKEEVLDKLFEKYPDVLILRYIVLYRKVLGSLDKIACKALVNSWVDAVLPFTRVQLSFSQTNVPTGRLSSNSSDGAERVSVNRSPKGALSYRYSLGSWECGFNSQGVPSGGIKRRKCKKIKKLPPEAGIEFDKLYGGDLRDRFYWRLAGM